MSKSMCRLRAGVAAAAAVAALAFTGAAGAADALDQSQSILGTSGGFSVSQTFQPAQIFTAGATGQLSRVRVWVKAGNGPTVPNGLRVAVTELVDGHPTVGENLCWIAQTCDGRWGHGAVLAEGSATVDSGSFSFADIVFPVPAPVTAGTQYAIVVFAAPGAQFTTPLTPGNLYAGGSTWFTNGDDPFFSDGTSPDNDLAFETFLVTSDLQPPLLSPPAPFWAQGSGPAGSGSVVYPAPVAFDAVDGPVAVTCLPASGSPFPLGTTMVNCSAADAAGNTASTGFPVTVTLAAFTSSPPSVSTSQQAAFSWSAAVPSRFSCALDGAAFAACSSPRTYNGLAAGFHTLCVKATLDVAAACSSWQIVSPGAPVVSIGGVVISGRSATVTFSADQLAPRFTCSLDGAAYRSCSSALKVNGLALGSHTVRVLATNFAGETSLEPAVVVFSIA
jgi:hypothetical protein